MIVVLQVCCQVGMVLQGSLVSASSSPRRSSVLNHCFVTVSNVPRETRVLLMLMAVVAECTFTTALFYSNTFLVGTPSPEQVMSQYVTVILWAVPHGGCFASLGSLPFRMPTPSAVRLISALARTVREDVVEYLEAKW